MEASKPERTSVRTCGLVLGLSPLQSEIWTGPAPPACGSILIRRENYSPTGRVPVTAVAIVRPFCRNVAFKPAPVK